ncbi:hypothetical protein INT45_011734 [Circinella minor]|uniref:Uncharacterized protein n=1 Tax=Circinella minor TaxID=1195481 RepID=A0A8H7VP42_9FUNG|nr:hypothetical protein INT45_011734 [Circinella minor]
MSNFIDNAVRLLHERTTYEPAPFAADHPAEFEILRSQYENFINNEETRIGCKFIDKTSGVYTKERNPAFISKYGSHQHPVSPARQQTDETRVVKMGRPKTLSFVQEWKRSSRVWLHIENYYSINRQCSRYGFHQVLLEASQKDNKISDLYTWPINHQDEPMEVETEYPQQDIVDLFTQLDNDFILTPYEEAHLIRLQSQIQTLIKTRLQIQENIRESNAGIDLV